MGNIIPHILKNTINNKRYRLHQIIKHHFKYNARERKVYVPNSFSKKEAPKQLNNAMEHLNKLNYSLQIIID